MFSLFQRWSANGSSESYELRSAVIDRFLVVQGGPHHDSTGNRRTVFLRPHARMNANSQPQVALMLTRFCSLQFTIPCSSLSVQGAAGVFSVTILWLDFLVLSCTLLQIICNCCGGFWLASVIVFYCFVGRFWSLWSGASCKALTRRNLLEGGVSRILQLYGIAVTSARRLREVCLSPGLWIRFCIYETMGFESSYEEAFLRMGGYRSLRFSLPAESESSSSIRRLKHSSQWPKSPRTPHHHSLGRKQGMPGTYQASEPSGDRGRRITILSIDGGGVRGLIPSSILEQLESYLQVHSQSGTIPQIPFASLKTSL